MNTWLYTTQVSYTRVRCDATTAPVITHTGSGLGPLVVPVVIFTDLLTMFPLSSVGGRVCVFVYVCVCLFMYVCECV